MIKAQETEANAVASTVIKLFKSTIAPAVHNVIVGTAKAVTPAAVNTDPEKLMPAALKTNTKIRHRANDGRSATTQTIIENATP